MPGRESNPNEVRRYELVKGRTYRVLLTGAILCGEFTSRLIEATEESLFFANGVTLSGDDMEFYNARGPEIRWTAQYDDGTIINQFQDGKELSYDNLEDRERIVSFALWDFETRKPVLTLHLDPGQKLIYRRRCWQRPGEEMPFQVVYLVGWRRTIAGECIQSIAYVFEDTGRVELAGRFRENHPLFDSPKLRTFEE